MKFLPYEDVPLYLAVNGKDGEYIFAESASLSVNQPLSTVRQIDDNVFQICEYGLGQTMEYSPTTFTSNNTFTVSLGPSGGPPKPLATSIHKIPKDTLITFPNGKHLYFKEDIFPNGHDYLANVYAKSGDWSLSEGEAQSGYFTPIYKSASNGPVVGKLDVSFYSNTGNLPHFFNITGLSNPYMYPPIDEEKITGFLGDFIFHNAYLTNFQFSLSPNSIAQASASFDLYGAISHDSAPSQNYHNSSLYDQQSIPHGQYSSIINTQSEIGIEHPVSFSYSISIERSPRYSAPDINSTPDFGLLPDRVSKKKTQISMSIGGESIDPNLIEHGMGGKRANLSVNLRDLSYSDFEDNSNGLLHTFTCSGVVNSQSLSVSSNGYLNGQVSVSQTYE